MSFRLHVTGPRACFPRPEFHADRISYDVITPLAARGIFEAIYWKPAIRWWVDRVEVLSPICFERSSSDLPTGRRRELALVDVNYLLEAHFELSDVPTQDHNAARHTKMFLQRARNRRYFRPPHLGGGEAKVTLVEKGEAPPPSTLVAPGPVDLGWMIHDYPPGRSGPLRMFRAVMVDGVIDVPPPDSPALAE